MRWVKWVVGLVLILLLVGMGSVIYFVKYFSGDMVLVSGHNIKVDSKKFSSWVSLFKGYEDNKKILVLLVKNGKPVRGDGIITQSLTDNNVSDVTLSCQKIADKQSETIEYFELIFDAKRYNDEISLDLFNRVVIQCVKQAYLPELSIEKENELMQRVVQKYSEESSAGISL